MYIISKHFFTISKVQRWLLKKLIISINGLPNSFYGAFQTITHNLSDLVKFKKTIIHRSGLNGMHVFGKKPMQTASRNSQKN